MADKELGTVESRNGAYRVSWDDRTGKVYVKKISGWPILLGAVRGHRENRRRRDGRGGRLCPLPRLIATEALG
jgi:hypothetical protein